MCSSIQISHKTKARLGKLGTVTATYESVIVEMLEHLEKCDQWWAKR